METKVCNKCNIKKEINQFYFRAKVKGNYSNSCKKCESEMNKKYREANKEAVNLVAKNWKENNKEKTKEYNKKYKADNKSEIKEKGKIYRSENKEKERERDRRNKKKKLNDPVFKMAKTIRDSIGRAFKKNKKIKSKNTINILGCSFEDFKLHIESQFEEWMNWDNFGPYLTDGKRTWQIDHIIPISLADTEEKIILLNHYTNLRPLGSKENLEKSNFYSSSKDSNKLL